MDPTIILAMGIPSAITAFCFWWMERKIERRQAEQDKKDDARKQNEIIVLKGTCIRLLNMRKRSSMNRKISSRSRGSKQFIEGGWMKPKNSRQRTYTKNMMNRIITVALVDIQFPFVLALLGRDQIAETMGGLIVTEIVGVFLVYCAKSFFETKESEKIRLLEMQIAEKEMEDEDYE